MSITIKVSKQDLEQAVRVAGIAIGSKGNEDDVTTHYVFRVTDAGGAEVLTSNSERLLASSPIKAAEVTGTPGDMFTIPGKRLSKFLSALRDCVVTATLENGLVTLAASTATGQSRGRGRTVTLDPRAKNFPFWDKNLAEAKLVGTVDVVKLVDMLTYSRIHASDQESRSPSLVAVVVRDGMLLATDSTVMSLVTPQTMPDLAKSQLRVNQADIAPILSFLDSKRISKVDLIEHDPKTPLPSGTGQQCLYLRGDDGAMLGITRWPKEFPPLKVDKSEKDKCWFTLSSEDLAEALQALGAFAVSEDDKFLYVRFEQNKVILGLESASKASDNDEWALPMIAQDNMSAFESSNYKGFYLDRSFVREILSFYGEDTIRFGIGWTQKNGYVRFRQEDRAGDDFLSLLVWLKK